MRAQSEDRLSVDTQRLIEQFLAARADDARAVLEGFHPLKHALRFGARIEIVAIGDEARLAHLTAALAPDIADRLQAALRVRIDGTLLQRFTPTPPPEPIMAIARRPAVDASRVLASRTNAPIVFLESPAHLPNIGACVRVAAAAGAEAVFTSGMHDPWHPRALRGSAGLHFAIPVGKVEELPRTARPVVAFDPGGVPLGERIIPHDAVLAFGSERRGLSETLRNGADHVVAIPMRRGVSSLSIATAVAVALYSMARR